MKNITLTPAYGRDYKSKGSVFEDFMNNKDFIIADTVHLYSGKPVNRQALKMGYDTVYIRYAKLRKVAVLIEHNGEWMVT